MRITHKTLANTVINNLNTSMRRMNRLQEQLSSGKAIARPSDDPAGVARAMIIHTTQNDIEQYQKNIADATTWMNVTDAALGQMEEALIKARDKVLQAANDTQGIDERETIARQLDQFRDELIDLGNQTYQGRYLFAGNKTTGAKPFAYDSASKTVTYGGNTARNAVEFSQGITMDINTHGVEIFGPARETLQALIDLSVALRQPTVNRADIDAGLNGIDTAIDRVLSVHTDIGARVQRLQMANERYDRDKLNIESLLSKIEDTDVVQAMTDLKMQENGYRMALGSAARVIQPTLMDFLR